jgi:hypothetical protein
MKVARHEVPGKQCRVNPSRRARLIWCRGQLFGAYSVRCNSRIWAGSSLAALRSCRSLRDGLVYMLSRHFVPGYVRAIPLGSRSFGIQELQHPFTLSQFALALGDLSFIFLTP